MGVVKKTEINALKILLIGPTGQVGYELFRSLQTLGDVVATTINEKEARLIPRGLAHLFLDLTDGMSIRKTVLDIRPDIIVNAAAYTAVDKAEQEKNIAMKINGDSLGILGETARKIGSVVIHYSTDYVFDGSGDIPWRENSPTSPLNFYGVSKLAGEQNLMSSGALHLILRTSWVHGVFGSNFVKTMIRLGRESEEVSVVCDQWGAPTSARVLSDITSQILVRALCLGSIEERNRFFKSNGGIFHCACGGQTSWHGFAKEIFSLAKEHNFPLKLKNVIPITSMEYQTLAKRPTNSRLDCSKLTKTFNIKIPSWELALSHNFPSILYSS